MASYLTQPQHQAAVAATRVRSAFACAMAAPGPWSVSKSVDDILGTTDHKPERPRRLRVPSP